MRSGGGFLLVAVGLLLLWMAITGRLDCLSAFADCVVNGNSSTTATTNNPLSGGSMFQIPSLPKLPTLR